MRLLGNILWLFLAGFWLAVGYLVAGIVAFVLIVTIPFGVASWRLAGYVLWPFGRVVVAKPTAGVGSALGNILWFLVAGLWLALGHLLAGLLLCLTIIGIRSASRRSRWRASPSRRWARRSWPTPPSTSTGTPSLPRPSGWAADPSGQRVHGAHCRSSGRRRGRC